MGRYRLRNLNTIDWPYDKEFKYNGLTVWQRLDTVYLKVDTFSAGQINLAITLPLEDLTSIDFSEFVLISTLQKHHLIHKNHQTQYKNILEYLRGLLYTLMVMTVYCDLS